MSHSAYTMHFKDIYPSYEEFCADDYYHDFEDRLTAFLPSAPVVDDLTKRAYKLIYRHYCNSEICYENVDEFRNMFWERLEQSYVNYCIREENYKKLLTLSDKELLAVNSYITNNTMATDDVVSQPLDIDSILTNVTDQTSGRSFGSKAERFRLQIYNSNMMLTDNFIKSFANLFIRLGSSSSII